MKIAVYGAGAFGSLIAGYLVRAGHDVAIIDPWYSHITAIQKHGLRVMDQEGEFHAPMRAFHHDQLKQAAPIDILFVAVKSLDTEIVARYAAPYLSDEGYIVSAQNSLNEEVISSVVGPERTIGLAASGIMCAVYEPGLLLRHSLVKNKIFQVGELDGSITPRLEKLAQLLASVAGTDTTENIWDALWTKLATNCMGNGLAGLVGTIGAILSEDVIARKIRMHIGKEVVLVGEAHGITFGNIRGLPPECFKDLDGPGGKLIEETWLKTPPSPIVGSQPHRPSLLQDVMKGRRSEVDYLNGLIVRKGSEVGVPTPANQAMVDVVHRIDSGELEPGPDNLALFTDVV
jgi:2-dehydropantoate 2-reductase